MKLEVDNDSKLYPYGTESQVMFQYIGQIKNIISFEKMYIKLYGDSHVKLDHAKSIMKILID